MDAKLQKRIISALKVRRDELHEQLVTIADVLDQLDPPKIAPVVRRTAAEMNEQRILEWLTNDWTTYEQLLKKTGLSKHSATRALNRMVNAKKLEVKAINQVVHYRQPIQTMRLVAGVGELK
jgi:sulfur carrier protein ThiS